MITITYMTAVTVSNSHGATTNTSNRSFRAVQCGGTGVEQDTFTSPISRRDQNLALVVGNINYGWWSSACRGLEKKRDPTRGGVQIFGDTAGQSARYEKQRFVLLLYHAIRVATMSTSFKLEELFLK